MSLLIGYAPSTAQATHTSFTMDSTGDMVAWRWRARSTTAIKKLLVWCTAKTGGPRDIGVVIAADVNGVPSISSSIPVDIGGGSPTLVTVANASVSNAAVATFTFTNAYTPTANTDYWVCLYALGTGGTTWDASNRYQWLQNYSFATGFSGELSASSTDGAGVTWAYGNSAGGAIAAFSVQDNSSAYLPTICSFCAGATTGSVAFQASSNPDEYGNTFTIPSSTTVDLYGMTYHHSLASASLSDHDLFAYTDPLGTPSLKEQLSVDVSAWYPSTTQTRFLRRLEAGPYSLTAGQVVSVAVRNTGTGNTTIGVMIANAAAALAATDVFNGTSGITRDGGSGAYSAQTDRIYGVFPLLAFTGTSGGGLLRHPGMSGGLSG
jgi:hypothetical protein